KKTFKFAKLDVSGRSTWALVVDSSVRGLGFFCNSTVLIGDTVSLTAKKQQFKIVHSQRAAFGFSRLGAQLLLLNLMLCFGLKATTANAETLSESWYLMRAHSNIQIGNYKAAVEAYDKILQTSPDNTDVLK